MSGGELNVWRGGVGRVKVRKQGRRGKGVRAGWGGRDEVDEWSAEWQG